MKITFKKIPLEENIDIVKWTLLDENEISNFRHYAIELFPELENVKENEKSIAYTLTFMDDAKTLSDEEVMQVFNKIIEYVTSKLNCSVRDN